MFYPEDVKDMSMEELLTLKEAVENELKHCRNAERDRLIQTICDSMNALYDKGYNVELPVPYWCEECECEDYVDAFYVFCGGSQHRMTPADFKVW